MPLQKGFVAFYSLSIALRASIAVTGALVSIMKAVCLKPPWWMERAKPAVGDDLEAVQELKVPIFYSSFGKKYRS